MYTHFRGGMTPAFIHEIHYWITSVQVKWKILYFSGEKAMCFKILSFFNLFSTYIQSAANK